MKKFGIFAVLFAFCLVFAGCKGAEKPADAEATDPAPIVTEPAIIDWNRSGATLKLPDNFNDCSELPLGQQYEFLYSGSMLGIYGIKESKDNVAEGITDLASYCSTKATALNAEIKEVNSIPTLTYEEDTQDDPQTYVCAYYETETDYWTITSYCPSIMHETYQETMLSYITSATIQ